MNKREEEILRCEVSGRKIKRNPLNKVNLTKYDLEDYLCEGCL